MALSDRLKWILEVDNKSAIKAFQDTGNEAEKGLKKAEDRLDKLGGNLTKFGAGAMAFAGVAGAGLIKLGSDASGYAVEMGKASDATGFGVEQFSRLNEAAGDLGVATGTLEKSLGFMNKTAGNSPETFAKLGVEIARTKDGSVDANGTFLAVIDRLNAIKDPAERAAAGTKLLGRGWQEMAELVGAGSDSLTKSMAAVSDAKVITPEELKKARDFRAAVDQMKDALQDLAINIGQGVAPMLATAARGVGTLVDGFGKLDSITSGAAGKVLGLGTAVIGIAGALSFVAGKVITARDRFHDLFGASDKLSDSIATVGRRAKVTAVEVEALAGAQTQLGLSARQTGVLVGASLVAGVAGLAGASLGLKEINVDLLDVVGANREAIKAAGIDYDDLELRVANNEVTFAQLKKTIDAVGGGMVVHNGIVVKVAEALTQADVAARGAVEGQEAYAAAILEGQKRTEEANLTSAEQAVALGESQRAAQLARDEQYRLEAAAGRAADAFRRQHEELDGLTKKISTDNAFYDLQDQFDGLVNKIWTTTAAVQEGTTTQEQAMRDVAREINNTKQAVIDYTTQIGNVPDEKVTEYLALIDEGAYDEVQRRLDILTRNRTMELSITAKGGIGFGSVVPGSAFHDGGVIGGPGPVGSEVPILAKVGETVVPTHKPGFQMPATPSVVHHHHVTVNANGDSKYIHNEVIRALTLARFSR